MKKIPLVKLAILGLIPILLIGCNNTTSVNDTIKKVMTPTESLNFFNLRDVGQIHPLEQGKAFLTKQDIKAKGLIDDKSVRALSTSLDIAYFEVGDWYVPATLYNNLQLAEGPFGLSSDALNLLEGSELTAVFTYPPDKMRMELEKHGLTVKNVRELTFEDGLLDANDLEVLARKADASTSGRILALSGSSYLNSLKLRVELYGKGVQK